MGGPHLSFGHWIALVGIFSRPGQSQGLLCKHLCHSLTYLLTDPKWLKMVLPVSIPTILTFSFIDSKFWRASKLHYWFKSYGHFDECVDFAYWCSCLFSSQLKMLAYKICLRCLTQTVAITMTLTVSVAVTSNMTCDSWQMWGSKPFFNFSVLAFTIWEWRCSDDISTKDHWIN